MYAVNSKEVEAVSLEIAKARLIALRTEAESADLEKAELLASVKAGRTYKAEYKTFDAFAQAIGYHRTYCYDLIRVWECEPVRANYALLGAFRAVKVAKSGLEGEALTAAVEYAKGHSSSELVKWLRGAKDNKSKASEGDAIARLLSQQAKLEASLAQVRAELEKLLPKVSRPKAVKKDNKGGKAEKPAVVKVGDIVKLLKGFSPQKHYGPEILNYAHFRGETVEVTNLESYAVLTVGGLDVFASVEVKELEKVTSAAVSDFVGDADHLAIVSGGASISLPAWKKYDDKSNVSTDADAERPIRPTVDGEILWQGTLAAYQLASMGKVASHASKDTTRPILNGVYFGTEGKQIAFTAADGFRLASHKLGIESEQGFGAVIKLESAVAIAKSFEALKAEEVHVTVYRKLNHIIPARGDVGEIPVYNPTMILFGGKGNGAHLAVFTQCEEGKYPDYAQIIPRNQPAVVEVTVDADILPLLAQAEKQARDQAEIVKFTASGNVKLAVKGKGEWEYNPPSILGDGIPHSIYLNAKYLKEAIESMPDQECTIRLQAKSHEEKFGKVEVSDRPAYLYFTDRAEAVIMPMHADEF